MLPKIELTDTMLEHMTHEDRVYKSAAEMVIHQFQSEPTNGIQTTGNSTDSVDKRTLGRRFREFCEQQYPDLDPWRLWGWYRHYLVQERRYTVREDRGYGIARFTGYELITPRMKYQNATEFKPRPQPPKVVDLTEYNPERDMYGSNGHHREVLN